jgi:hypothetical protein
MRLAVLVLGAASLALPSTGSIAAQVAGKFAGTWILDVARSGPSHEIWGQRRAKTFEIRQTATEITIDTMDGSVGVARSLSYRLDGVRTEMINDDLGDLYGFTRRIRTWAELAGSRLTTHTLLYAGDVSGNGGSSIDRVRIFQVLPGGRRLEVEMTGNRPEPPAILHGRPYHQVEDLVYSTDKATYSRTVRTET